MATSYLGGKFNATMGTGDIRSQTCDCVRRHKPETENPSIYFYPNISKSSLQMDKNYIDAYSILQIIGGSIILLFSCCLQDRYIHIKIYIYRNFPWFFNL